MEKYLVNNNINVYHIVILFINTYKNVFAICTICILTIYNFYYPIIITSIVILFIIFHIVK